MKKTAQTAAEQWDESDDGSMPVVNAPFTPTQEEQPQKDVAKITAPAIQEPAFADPFPKGEVPPETEETLSNNTAEVLKVLHVAQAAVEATPNPQRSQRNPAFMIARNRLQRVRNHFHALQQGMPVTNAIDANHFEAARRGRIAGLEKRSARLAEVEELLKVPVEKAPLQIRSQTDPVRKKLIAEAKVQAKLRAAQLAVLTYEHFFLVRCPDLFLEDTREALRLEIGREADPVERRGLVANLARLSNPESMELTRVAGAEVRKAFSPVREAILALFSQASECLAGYRRLAQSDELRLAEGWGVPVAETEASRQFAKAESEIESMRKGYQPHNLALPAIGGHEVCHPAGLLEWFGL